MVQLENTKKILDLLGYKLVRYNNVWTIVDDKNQAVGSIKPINVKGRVKYHFVIDSDTININYVHEDMFMLNFKDIGSIYFGRFDDPAFTFVSEKYGNITFDLKYLHMYDSSEFSREKGLEYRYRYNENGHTVTEQAFVNNSALSDEVKNQSYGYSLSTNNLRKTEDDETRDLLAVTLDDNPKDIHVTIKGKNNRVVYDKVKQNTSIEEYAIRDGRGIELFKSLRGFINSVLPFKKDLLHELYKDKIEDYGLTFLFENPNLSYEKRFLDLLGYKYAPKRDGNKLIILDNHGKEVGYTKWGDNSFRTVIESDTISFSNHRDNTDEKLYIFTVKNVGEVILRFGKYRLICDNSIISLCSKKYGFMSIDLDDNSIGATAINSEESSLSVTFSYMMDEYKVWERTYLRNKDFDINNTTKAYDYSLSYSEPDIGPQSYGEDAFAFSMKNNPDTLNVERRDYYTKEEQTEQQTKTVEQFAIEDGRGIELFNRVRNLFNELMPFTRDVIYEIIKDKIDEYGLQMFFSEEKEKGQAKKI